MHKYIITQHLTKVKRQFCRGAGGAVFSPMTEVRAAALFRLGGVLLLAGGGGFSLCTIYITFVDTGALVWYNISKGLR